MSTLQQIVIAFVVLVVAGGTVHLAYLLVAYHRGNLSWQRQGEGRIEDFFDATRKLETDTGDSRAERGDAVGIRCPHCNTVNDASYSFCRECANDLDGGR